MSFTVRRVNTKTSELGNEKMKVLYVKRFLVDSRIDEGQVSEINITECWDVNEFYDYSDFAEEKNILKRIADRLRFRLGVMHHDDEGHIGESLQ